MQYNHHPTYIGHLIPNIRVDSSTKICCSGICIFITYLIYQYQVWLEYCASYSILNCYSQCKLFSSFAVLHQLIPVSAAHYLIIPLLHLKLVVYHYSQHLLLALFQLNLFPSHLHLCVSGNNKWQILVIMCYWKFRWNYELIVYCILYNLMIVTVYSFYYFNFIYNHVFIHLKCFVQSEKL